MGNLEKTTKVSRDVLETIPPDYINPAGRLKNLRNVLGEGFLKTGAMADIKKAIKIRQKAVITIPLDYPDRVATLDNLET